MEILATLLFDFVLVLFYLSVGFAGFMLIQGITYWSTGFNIYKFLNKKIDEQISK